MTVQKGRTGCGSQDAVHRIRLAVGERLHRELQRETEERVPERRDILLAEGRQDRDRRLANGIQH